MDNLLTEEEVSDLVTGLKIIEDSTLVEKRVVNDERGGGVREADIIIWTNLTLKEDLNYVDNPSYSHILLSTPAESLNEEEVETKTCEEDVKRSTSDDPYIEFVE